SVPEGFKIDLVAGEPRVVQPIAFDIDHRGRLWVIENYSYPDWKAQGRDRIVILSDENQDGSFESRKVFWDGGRYLTGLALGFGGVWICNAPDLAFIPDRDGDDKPDAEPQILLEGWSTKGKHNVLNALTWGPDGWLYGANGITAPSRVGPPGTPDDQRTFIDCGIWRFHPTRRVFEVVVRGTTNPWGIDYDDHGQMFFTNCVIKHVWHVLPGAHYLRMHGKHKNPYLYELMASPADHRHWGEGKWTDARGNKARHDTAGGGHAHAGALIYLADAWPKRFRNTLLTCNVHGLRINHDRLARRGSGYVATHEQDFLRSADPWFRGLEMKTGPAGEVYLTDWYDFGECHDTRYTHRESGRIYRITHGRFEPARVNLAGLSDRELVELQLHRNDWYVRRARRLLQERAASGADLFAAHTALRRIRDSNPDVTRQLRAVWALYVTGALPVAERLALLDHASEFVRAWGVRLLIDEAPPSAAVVAEFADLARTDASGLVRLHLASAMTRLAGAHRWALGEALAERPEQETDRNLQLMIWYGLEPLVKADRTRALQLAGRTKLALIRRFIARRLADG
ncbi:MAG: dehydrogenase, partial [Phycisphaerae bacterium]|nr:dehydrogenase [Phycisphaerae bacterium]